MPHSYLLRFYLLLIMETVGSIGILDVCVLLLTWWICSGKICITIWSTGFPSMCLRKESLLFQNFHWFYILHIHFWRYPLWEPRWSWKSRLVHSEFPTMRYYRVIMDTPTKHTHIHTQTSPNGYPPLVHSGLTYHGSTTLYVIMVLFLPSEHWRSPSISCHT